MLILSNRMASNKMKYFRSTTKSIYGLFFCPYTTTNKQPFFFFWYQNSPIIMLTTDIMARVIDIRVETLTYPKKKKITSQKKEASIKFVSCHYSTVKYNANRSDFHQFYKRKQCISCANQNDQTIESYLWFTQDVIGIQNSTKTITLKLIMLYQFPILFSLNHIV